MTKQDYYNQRLALDKEFEHYLLTGNLNAAKETKNKIGELMRQGLQDLGEQEFLEIELKFETDNY
jgi:hypothetical protein